MAGDMQCPRCVVEAEGLHHLVFQRPWSAEIWQEVSAECGQAIGSLQSNYWRISLKSMYHWAKEGNEEERVRLCWNQYVPWEI